MKCKAINKVIFLFYWFFLKKIEYMTRIQKAPKYLQTKYWNIKKYIKILW